MRLRSSRSSIQKNCKCFPPVPVPAAVAVATSPNPGRCEDSLHLRHRVGQVRSEDSTFERARDSKTCGESGKTQESGFVEEKEGSTDRVHRYP